MVQMLIAEAPQLLSHNTEGFAEVCAHSAAAARVAQRRCILNAVAC